MQTKERDTHIDIKHIVSFRKPCFLDVSFIFFSRLGKSGKKIFVLFFLFVCLFFVAYR